MFNIDSIQLLKKLFNLLNEDNEYIKEYNTTIEELKGSIGAQTENKAVLNESLAKSKEELKTNKEKNTLVQSFIESYTESIRDGLKYFDESLASSLDNSFVEFNEKQRERENTLNENIKQDELSLNMTISKIAEDKKELKIITEKYELFKKQINDLKMVFDESLAHELNDKLRVENVLSTIKDLEEHAMFDNKEIQLLASHLLFPDDLLIKYQSNSQQTSEEYYKIFKGFNHDIDEKEEQEEVTTLEKEEPVEEPEEQKENVNDAVSPDPVIITNEQPKTNRFINIPEGQKNIEPVVMETKSFIPQIPSANIEENVEEQNVFDPTSDPDFIGISENDELDDLYIPFTNQTDEPIIDGESVEPEELVNSNTSRLFTENDLTNLEAPELIKSEKTKEEQRIIELENKNLKLDEIPVNVLSLSDEGFQKYIDLVTSPEYSDELQKELKNRPELCDSFINSHNNPEFTRLFTDYNINEIDQIKLSALNPEYLSEKLRMIVEKTGTKEIDAEMIEKILNEKELDTVTIEAIKTNNENLFASSNHNLSNILKGSNNFDMSNVNLNDVQRNIFDRAIKKLNEVAVDDGLCYNINGSLVSKSDFYKNLLYLVSMNLASPIEDALVTALLYNGAKSTEEINKITGTIKAKELVTTGEEINTLESAGYRL